MDAPEDSRPQEAPAGLSISAGLLRLPKSQNPLISEHFVIHSDINYKNPKTNCLLDTAATGYAFVDVDFARSLDLAPFALPEPIPLSTFGGALVRGPAKSRVFKKII